MVREGGTRSDDLYGGPKVGGAAHLQSQGEGGFGDG